MTFVQEGRWSTAEDGTRYRDLNGNGRLDPYEDPRLPIDERVEDLVGRLSLAEKAGLMLQTVAGIPDGGDIDAPPERSERPRVRDLVADDHITHFNVHALPDPATAARWVNAVQTLAESSPHGIPVTFSTDPRHSFMENSGASFGAGYFSAWPEPLGLGAIGDEQTVREFADIARQEYLAVGLRAALHPTLDLATSPRWARQYSTFGQDAELVGRLAVAYVEGFEGTEGVTARSVACMAKHFPGGGPQKDGEDSHFPYGREHVYPGERFEEHLAPFRQLLARGVSAIMPAYGLPIGLERDGVAIEEVGVGFNRQLVTGLLREELGYDGVVCTDWGLVTESRMADRSLPPRAWGVERLSEDDRVLKILEAGNDQLGGEQDPSHIIRLVESGRVSEDRIDVSVRRLLRVKFALGLFDDPFVDEHTASQLVGRPDFVAAGRRAQARSVTVLSTDDRAALPLRAGARLYAEGLDETEVRDSGLQPVASPGEADVIVVRLSAPFEPRDHYMLEASFRTGSLEFAPDEIARVATLAQSAPVIVVVHLDRPAILTGLLPHAAALVAEYGTSGPALLDVLTGRILPEGRLPFQLPATADAAYSSRPDVPGDAREVLFDVGHGIDLGGSL